MQLTSKLSRIFFSSHASDGGIVIAMMMASLSDEKIAMVDYKGLRVDDFEIIPAVDFIVIRMVDLEVNNYYFEVNSGTSIIKKIL